MRIFLEVLSALPAEALARAHISKHSQAFASQASFATQRTAGTNERTSKNGQHRAMALPDM